MGHKYTKILGDGNGDAGPGHVQDAGQACLYLGSIDWLIEDDILQELEIRAIVSVLPHQPQYVQNILKKHDIDEDDYVVYRLEDSSEEYISIFDDPNILNTCEFIHHKRLQGKSVLVHCDAGITRSPAVVVSYIMKYGTDLHNPKVMGLNAAMNIVSELRERMDICVFHAELTRLEGILLGNEPMVQLSDRNRNMSFPRTPKSPLSWSQMALEGETYIELSLIRATWNGIRAADGGQRAFGQAIFMNLIDIGGARMRDMFAETDIEHLSMVMTCMMHAIVWSLNAHNMDKLCHFHRYLDLDTEDFELFIKAVLMALKEKLGATEEALHGWEKFFHLVFNRWAKRINKRSLSAPQHLLTSSKNTVHGGCPMGHGAPSAPPEPKPEPVQPKEPAAPQLSAAPALGLPPKKFGRK
uniref:protein-tyrosine-phosphatase n=1 Tax=Eutreptiella gymnastica TaxID=73025 RepID=A0A7S1I8K4_9EUGL